MGLKHVGNTGIFEPRASSSYLSGKGLLISQIGHQPAEGDRLVKYAIGRGTSVSGSGLQHFYVFSSDVDDIATATVLAVYDWTHTEPAVTVQEFVLPEPLMMDSSKFYWFLISRVPSGYSLKSGPSPYANKSFVLADVEAMPVSLSDVTFSDVTVDSVVWAAFTNPSSKTVVTFGTPGATESHIAKGTPYEVAGAECEYSDYSSRGNLVTIHPDGHVVVDGEGSQEFQFALRANSGEAFGPVKTCSVRDATTLYPLVEALPALSWSANEAIQNGTRITIRTNGAYNFGVAPSDVVQLGFGKGWLYEQPLLTVLMDQNMDGIVVSEGGARRIEEKDGIRVLASRLFDATAWSGMQNAGRNIEYFFPQPLATGQRIATFQSYRLDSMNTPENWQFKNVRIHAAEGPSDNMIAHYSWRNNFVTTYTDATDSANSYYESVQPHANYGWQTYGMMMQVSSPDTVDGYHSTILCDRDDVRHVVRKEQLMMTNDSAHTRQMVRLRWQDYFDSSSGTPNPPGIIDVYLSDIQAQVDSFGVVMLADGPTPLTSRNIQQQPTVIDPTILWSADEVSVDYWDGGRTWDVGFYHVYNGTTGAFECSVHLFGTYTPDLYNWKTDTVGIYTPTNSAKGYIGLVNTDLDPSAEAYVDYYISFKRASDEPAVAGTPGDTTICRGLSSTYNSALYIKLDGSVTIKGESGGTVTLCPAGTFPAPIGKRCNWRLRIWNPAVQNYPELVDEDTGVRIDQAANYPAGWTRWIPVYWMRGGANAYSGINGTFYNVKAEAPSGVLYDLRLEESNGSTLHSAHNGAIAASIANLNNMAWVNDSV